MVIQPEKFYTDSLRRSPMGEDICQIMAAAINSADAEIAVQKKVSLINNHLRIARKTYDLDKYKHIYIIGCGKASVPMAKGIYAVLGANITSGIVITKDGYRGIEDPSLEKLVTIIEASHPIPDQRNLDASEQLSSLARNVKQDDLVICLFSGGGSALMTRSMPGISLQDIQDTTALLLQCGASIHEINTIRKHFDELKGGGLARLLFPATVVSLLISDVVGDELDSIASGPMAADSTTYQDAWQVFIKYQILDRIPEAIRSHIKLGMESDINETVKPGDQVLKKVHNMIIADNTMAALAALQTAKARGYRTKLVTTSLQGEAAIAGKTLASSARSISVKMEGEKPPMFLVAGGETAVTIKGSGMGGRNQELALGAVKVLSGDDQVVLVSLATDGGDGPTDAAGAVVTNQTYTNGLAKGLNPDEYLQNNDSYHYFEPLGDLIKIGPTLTNVNDLVFIICG